MIRFVIKSDKINMGPLKALITKNNIHRAHRGEKLFIVWPTRNSDANNLADHGCTYIQQYYGKSKFFILSEKELNEYVIGMDLIKFGYIHIWENTESLNKEIVANGLKGFINISQFSEFGFEHLTDKEIKKLK